MFNFFNNSKKQYIITAPEDCFVPLSVLFNVQSSNRYIIDKNITIIYTGDLNDSVFLNQNYNNDNLIICEPSETINAIKSCKTNYCLIVNESNTLIVDDLDDNFINATAQDIRCSSELLPNQSLIQCNDFGIQFKDFNNISFLYNAVIFGKKNSLIDYYEKMNNFYLLHFTLITNIYKELNVPLNEIIFSMYNDYSLEVDSQKMLDCNSSITLFLTDHNYVDQNTNYDYEIKYTTQILRCWKNF